MNKLKSFAIVSTLVGLSWQQESYTFDSERWRDDFFGAFAVWSSKIKLTYKDMLQPLFDGVRSKNDREVADELKFYVSCEACLELSGLIKQPPNDQLITDLIFTAGMNACQEYLDYEACLVLGHKFLTLWLDSFFSLFVSDDFFCGYLLPLCDEKFVELPFREFANRVLKDKPVEAADDEFVNNLYREIKEESLKQITPTYRVLQISDWHVDLEYTPGRTKQNC